MCKGITYANADCVFEFLSWKADSVLLNINTAMQKSTSEKIESSQLEG